MGFIDAHVHIWTPDLAHYPLAKGYKKEDMKPPSFTPKQLFEHTKPAGVDRINLIQMSYYRFDNSYMLDMMALYPKVFVGTAIVDPHSDDAPKLMTEMGKKHVRAFRIHPRISKQPPAKWLQPKGYGPMFETAAKNRQAISCLIDPDSLPELDRMCKKFPKTPVVIDHICRIGVDGKIRNKDVEALCAMAKHKEVLVKIGAFYALGKKKPPYKDLSGLIERVVKAFGVQRCMWESDSPFEVVEGNYQSSVDLVRKHLGFLTEKDREWLLVKTAEGFFFST